MIVAMVSEHASPLAVLGDVDAGGQNVHVASLARALAARGHEVIVHTRRDSAELPSIVELCPGVTVHHVDAGPAEPIRKDDLLEYMPAFGRELARYWKRRRPHVVHAHFWMSGLAALAGAAGLGVPVLQTFHALGSVKRRHQGAEDTSPPERIRFEQWIGQSCQRVIATCTDEVRELVALGVPADRIRVVPCGVDLHRFTPHGPAAPRPPWPRLLQVSRLVPRKGADVAIRALASLPEAELVLAGGPAPEQLDSDPEARRLRELAAEVGVADRLVLLGGVARAGIPSLFRSADVVLCPPRYEPFGIVPLEAMGCGVPVVASGVGGHLDTVADGVTGRLVPPDDPAALAAAVGDLLTAPRHLARYGAAGRARAEARYGWDRVAGATDEIYRAEVPAGRVYPTPNGRRTRPATATGAA
jgi:glycosyltransferase involved in cell wall biosynthesis